MRNSRRTVRASRPDARETALLLAHLLAAKQEAGSKEVTRARLAEITLRRVSGRNRLTVEFVAEVQEWLLRAGWVLFFAGNTYAVVQTRVIEGWGRISSRSIRADLDRVSRGEFEFDDLERLLLGVEHPSEDDD